MTTNNFTNELSNRTLPGDYYWKQYSMWEFAPEDSIKKFVKLREDLYCEYYLVKVTKITPTIYGNSWTTEVVKPGEEVPAEVLNWRI